MQIFTVNEVAEMLKVRKGFVYELIKQKQLKVIKMSERRLRISAEALMEYIMQEE